MKLPAQRSSVEKTSRPGQLTCNVLSSAGTTCPADIRTIPFVMYIRIDTIYRSFNSSLGALGTVASRTAVGRDGGAPSESER